MGFVFGVLVGLAITAPIINDLSGPGGFNPVRMNSRVTGPQVVQSPASTSLDQCAEACNSQATACIAFNWVVNSTAAIASGACELSGWGAEYMVLTNQSSEYYTKIFPRNDSAISPKVQ
jgi:hypothetical protein